jgi:hypothetical protein
MREYAVRCISERRSAATFPFHQRGLQDNTSWRRGHDHRCLAECWATKPIQAQFPKWRGHFRWQIEAKIEALQEAHAKVRAEVAKEEG